MNAPLSDDEIAKGALALWSARYERRHAASGTGFDDWQLPASCFTAPGQGLSTTPQAIRGSGAEQHMPVAKDPLCPLLSDLERLLAYLEAQHKQPHDAIYPCPACGDLHRWKLLSVLLNSVLERAYWPVAPGSILEALERMEKKPMGGLVLDP